MSKIISIEKKDEEKKEELPLEVIIQKLIVKK